MGFFWCNYNRTIIKRRRKLGNREIPTNLVAYDLGNNYYTIGFNGATKGDITFHLYNRKSDSYIINTTKLGSNGNWTTASLKAVEQVKSRLDYLNISAQEVFNNINKIHNKYDAEYNAESSEKNTKFVSKETISEETILDQLRKINSCFK